MPKPQVQKIKVIHKKYDGKKLQNNNLGVLAFLKINALQDLKKKPKHNTEVISLVQ